MELLLNQKFSPKFFSSESGISNITHLIRSYFKMGGHHIQFNVVSADTLRAAQEQPEKFQNLIVRVAGYSDYYNNLAKDLQDEIIRRSKIFQAEGFLKLSHLKSCIGEIVKIHVGVYQPVTAGPFKFCL